MAYEGVRVEGLRELVSSFALISDALKAELTAELRKAIEPVRAQAERRAGSGAIRNLHAGDHWAEVRGGATANFAYIVPAARRRARRGRPNLSPLLLNQYEAAAYEKEPEVHALLDGWLSRLGGEAGF